MQIYFLDRALPKAVYTTKIVLMSGTKAERNGSKGSSGSSPMPA